MKKVWNWFFGAGEEKEPEEAKEAEEKQAEMPEEAVHKDRGKSKDLPERNGEVVWMKRMFSHNVRIPMSVISGYGELLKQGLLSEEEKESSILSICENITYMNQILSVIFGEDSGSGLEPQNVDLVELTYKMQEYVKSIAAKIPVSIRIKAKKESLYIKAEAVPIMRIFYQLYENAFKYLKAGDEIQISLYPVEREQVMVVFKDNGKELLPEEIPHLFEQGFRGKNSASKPGSGFGLSGVKQIVEQYHGTISASGGGRKGLSIVMLFPVAEKNTEEGNEGLDGAGENSLSGR